MWAQHRWLLKCHLGRNIEMKETPLGVNYLGSVWLSWQWWGQEARPRPRLRYLTCRWIPEQGLDVRSSVRSSDALLLEHMQNLSKISLHYDPAQEPRWDGLHTKQAATVAYIKLTSHSLCMLLPGELELPLYSGLSAMQMRETGQASCIKVVA